jgi:hypothetical protein
MEELGQGQESAQVVDNSMSGIQQSNTEDNDNYVESDDNGDPSQDNSGIEEEDDEVEINGKKFALPKSAAEKLKAERLMHADYTRKTQEIAETRKSIEQEREGFRQQAQAQQQYAVELSEVIAIDKQLDEFSKLDWNAIIDNDPTGALKLQQQQRDLQQQRNAAAQNITQKQYQMQLQEQQEVAKSLQEGNAILTRDIKGWSPELGAKLIEYGSQIGFKKERLAGITDPSVVKLLHKAYLYDQANKQQATQEKKEVLAAPVTRLKAASSGGSNDPSKMSDKAFAAWRITQIKNRN